MKSPPFKRLDHEETFGIQLITKLKKNMKKRLLPWMDKLLLHKRAIIESVVEQLKNISQIEHTRHRSPSTVSSTSLLA